MIAKEEYSDWKMHPVTKQLYEDMSLRINEFRDMLETSAGLDSIEDSTIRGVLAGFREVLEWKPESLEEHDKTSG